MKFSIFPANCPFTDLIIIASFLSLVFSFAGGPPINILTAALLLEDEDIDEEALLTEVDVLSQSISITDADGKVNFLVRVIDGSYLSMHVYLCSIKKKRGGQRKKKKERK